MAWARVQQTGTFSNAAGTTLAKAYGSNVTAGNLLAIGCIWASTTATCTVSGSVNGAATAVGASLASNGSRTEIFYVKNCAGGAETFTMTVSGSVASREIYIWEFSGIDTVTGLDAGNAATGSTANPSATLTTGVTPALMLGVCVANTGTLGAGSGWTLGTAQNGDASEEKNAPSAGAQTVAFTNVSASTWAMSMASFVEGGGGGGAPAPKQLAALGVG